MATVLLIDGFSEDSVFVDGKTPADMCDIYLPFLKSILRYNGIETEIFDGGGLEWNYSINGKSDRNLIYLPIISVADSLSKDVSFIYTDSTASDSVSFRIASNIRRNLEAVDKEKVIFINALHERDTFKRFSPIIVDNLRVAADSDEFLKQTDKLFLRAVVTAESICEHYLSDFRSPFVYSNLSH